MPRLNIESENLLYMTDFPTDVNWRTFKANVNRNGGGIKFIETFEAWAIYPVKDVILEFINKNFLDDFIANLQQKTIFGNAAVVYKIINAENRMDFCSSFLEKTGVDLLKCNGMPPIANSSVSLIGELSPRNRSISFSNLNIGGSQKSTAFRNSPQGQLIGSNFTPLHIGVGNTHNNLYNPTTSRSNFRVNRSPVSPPSPLQLFNNVSNFEYPALQKKKASPNNFFHASAQVEHKVNDKGFGNALTQLSPSKDKIPIISLAPLNSLNASAKANKEANHKASMKSSSQLLSPNEKTPIPSSAQVTAKLPIKIGIKDPKSTNNSSKLSPLNESISILSSADVNCSNLKTNKEVMSKGEITALSLATTASSLPTVKKTANLFNTYKDAEMIAYERFGISHFPIVYKSFVKTKEQALKKRMQFKIFEQDGPNFNDACCRKNSDRGD